ncbi:helix-turn-helix domain-containing protein [Mycobacterium sp. URHB0021]
MWAVLGEGCRGDQWRRIASAAGASTRTIWRYFRSKESCVEPVLAKSAPCFIAVMDRWPPGLSLGEHIAAEVIEHPLTPTDVDDRSARWCIATRSLSDAALRTSYLMVHDEMEPT